MVGLVGELAGTIVLAVISACAFLRLRCRGIGNPFGPLARRWSYTIIAITVVISVGLSLALVAASGQVRTAYVGFILPGGLWLAKVSGELGTGRSGMQPSGLAGCLTFPLRRLNDRMGDDLQYWCDDRSRAVADNPPWVSDAAQYYFNQVNGRLKDDRAQTYVNDLRESIKHKIKVMQMIEVEDTPARVEAALQSHSSTRDLHQFTIGDLFTLSRRLRTEAEHELDLLMAFAYRRGFYDLLIYPFRPSHWPARQTWKSDPNASAGTGPAAF
jgi:hypothetical protein